MNEANRITNEKSEILSDSVLILDPAALRLLAEEKAKTLLCTEPSRRLPEDSRQILYERQLHQIEWEIMIAEFRRSREELSRQKELYRHLTSAFMDGCFIIDERGVLTFANNALAAILNYDTPDDIIGINITELTDNSYKERVSRLVSELNLNGPAPTSGIVAMLRKDGQTVPTEVRLTGYIGPEGSRVTQGLVIDKTDRQRKEKHLWESVDRLQKIIETIPDAVAIIRSSDGIYLEVNKGFTHQTGYTREEIIGQSSLQPGFCLWVSLEDRDRLLATLTDRGEVSGFESRFRRKDGTPRYERLCARFIELNGETCILAVAHDITESRQYEIALQESEERFRKLVEHAPEGILVHGDHQVLFLNPAMYQILGAEEDTGLIGKSFFERIALEYHESVRDRQRYLKEFGSAEPPMEQEYLRFDGSRVPVETIGVPIVFQGKEANLVFVRDISARRKERQEKEKVQAQFLQAQKMESIGRLAGGVAHDFNNMLGVILAYTQLSAMETPPGTPLSSYLEQILKAGKGAADTVRQLMGFARKQIIKPEKIDLNKTVADMFKMLRRLIDENIDLRWDPGTDIGKVWLDPSQVNQILANLVVNSRDAITNTGVISIETESFIFNDDFCRSHGGSVPGEYVRLSVSDTGSGMSEEVQEHIFEPFFTTKEVGKGTGLGMATVYGIVKQNKGYITIHSRSGEGTTVRIYFPKIGTAPSGIRKGGSRDQVPTGTETVLLVEDQRDLLRVFQSILDRLGYSVLAADSPERALKQVENYSGQIHLLLTDIVMPGMNGLELAALLKQQKRDMKVPPEATETGHEGDLHVRIYARRPGSTRNPGKGGSLHRETDIAQKTGQQAERGFRRRRIDLIVPE
jgi:two-component system, cell cycle sensor histidine kinase and response regulator CckA